MLTIFSATTEYWKHFYCALQSSKVIEKFVIENVEDTQFTNERGIRPIPVKLGKKTSTFFQSCIQNCNGYMGWRFICTADETHMRSAINLVISKESYDLFMMDKKILKVILIFTFTLF